MTQTCLCGRPVRDAYTCPPCTQALTADLNGVPALTRELDYALGRRQRFTAPTGVTSRPAERPLPYEPAVSDLTWALRNTLLAWARLLYERTAGAATGPAGAAGPPPWGDRTTADVPTAHVALWLAARTGQLRTHPDAPTATDELRTCIAHAARAVDRPGDTHYAGTCGCLTPLHVPAGAHTIRCRGCGTTYDVEERRRALLGAAQDHLDTAPAIARALTASGLPLTADRLYGYAKRRRLLERTRDPGGRPLYRLGDVLELLQEVS